MGIAAYNRGSRAISAHIDQQLAESKRIEVSVLDIRRRHESDPKTYGPDGHPWQTREPNRQTPHSENGWQYHYPQ